MTALLIHPRLGTALTVGLMVMLFAWPARAEFLVNGTVVMDMETDLVWMRADDGKERSWHDALAYCENLAPPDELAGGYDDWRLPDANELLSLVKIDTIDPAIDTTIFPECRSENYWSSSPYAGKASGAWYVNFRNGIAHYYDWGRTYYVRCVRSGP